MSEKVAFVTGASRGIGKASALALAEVGYDLIITARTVKEGECYEHSPTLKSSDTRPLPGSLETTAGAIRERGRRVLPIRLDLLDRDSIEAAVEHSLSEWGRIDLLLNNAIYTGPGLLDRFRDLPEGTIEKIFQANVFAQVALTQLVLSHMLQRGSGLVLNMTSAVVLQAPPLPADQGGWGFAYAASKAAFHQLAGILQVEHGKSGVRFHNVEPGLVITEAMKQNGLAERFAKQFGGVTPDVPAAVIAWLASRPEAEEFAGQTVFAQKFYKRHALGGATEASA